MEKIIAYVNDTAHALQTLAPMRPQVQASNERRTHTEWILVACAPRLTRHVNKWLTHSARTQWRDKWSEKVFAELVPLLSADGSLVRTQVAQGSLVELTDKLLKEHGLARVLDARLALVGQDMMPLTREQTVKQENRWVMPGAVASMGTILALAAD